MDWGRPKVLRGDSRCAPITDQVLAPTIWSLGSLNTLHGAGGPGFRYFIGSAEFRDGVESAEVQAHEIYRIVCKALGFPPTTDPCDEELPEGKVSNLTTDTAAVMPKTAKVLRNNYRLFKGMIWTPCSCHVYNLHLVDQEKHFKSIEKLISRGHLIVTLFRNSAPRKLFQRSRFVA